jgi:signal transduction histidine kinase
MRTPLYVARTASQVTLEKHDRTEAEYREALHTIDQQLKRLSHIVEDMFVLARADAGVYPVEKREFYLDEVLAETVKAARLLGGRKDVQVELHQPDELTCVGDEGLIRQLVLILLDNAVKYSQPGGHVQVSVSAADDDRYSIDVRDNGPGIPAEAQARIFDRFFRTDKARSRSQAGEGSGAGLGLAIARWIAELHGGELVLVESSATGSLFRATLKRSVG